MAEFTVRIAGHCFGIHSLFESTREYCKRYLTEDTPAVFVAAQPADLAAEQALLEAEAIEEGIRIRKFPEPFLERSYIQRMVAEYLFEQGILMLHGSTVAVDGRAYLFTANCGTGKSTHTRLWRQVFGDRAVMVNDDKPFVELTDTGARVYGSPWSGKHGLDTNITVPLAGICILERGKENRITPWDPESALPMLLHQSYCPMDGGKRPAFEARVEAVARKTPLWRMACNKEPEAAQVAYEAMSKE